GRPLVADGPSHMGPQRSSPRLTSTGSQMPQFRYRFSSRAGRALLLTTALALASGAWTSRRDVARHEARPFETIVRLTSLGLERPTSDSVRVIVYSSGPARIGVDQLDLRPLTDTVRLSSLPMLALDVSQADVHVRCSRPVGCGSPATCSVGAPSASPPPAGPA